jgi:hypothetical protein
VRVRVKGFLEILEAFPNFSLHYQLFIEAAVELFKNLKIKTKPKMLIPLKILLCMMLSPRMTL